MEGVIKVFLNEKEILMLMGTIECDFSLKFLEKEYSESFREIIGSLSLRDFSKKIKEAVQGQTLNCQEKQPIFLTQRQWLMVTLFLSIYFMCLRACADDIGSDVRKESMALVRSMLKNICERKLAEKLNEFDKNILH